MLISNCYFLISLVVFETFKCQIDPRALEVKKSFLHAWNGYKKYAFGSDEVRPISNQTVNDRFQGWGATLIDSLSTLWLMDLKEEFSLAVSQIAKVDFTKSPNGQVLFFETVIRYLGGLVSGYDLSQEKVLLEKAVQLADRLMLAFNSPSGIPYPSIDFNTGRPSTNTRAVLAEIGTVQLEFTRLSQITKDPKYEKAALKVFKILDSLKKPFVGLYPILVDVNTGKFINSEITFGALGDSFYEYQIKTYMLTKEKTYLTMFDESLRGFTTLLNKTSDGLLYFNELDQNYNRIPRMDHLSFFVSAMLTLGYDYLKEERYFEIAKNLAETFYQIYQSTSTKLGPEVTDMNNNGFTIVNAQNNLRPELLESLFYLYKYTKDSKYQDYVYNIYQAFEKYSRTQTAYAGYRDVRNSNIKQNQMDVMESFFFAETFKYMYLSFMPSEFINFDKWVLNTEGHPLRIPR